MKKLIGIVGAGVLIAASVLVPTTAASAKFPEGNLCKNGKFHVLHNDTIVGQKGAVAKIKRGRYKMRVSKMSCAKASNLFHDFLGHGNTRVHGHKKWRLESSEWGGLGFRAHNGRYFQIKGKHAGDALPFF
ncbi:MAG: hypothetical protein U0904_01500 [Candidatus Nanopelagicales bacterium]|nr:hypothetical protein [Candidatus Nanopelagicales bacterium]